MIVKCPHCGKETETVGNPFRPFCSERCRLIDLSNWIDGTYRIPEAESEESEEEGSDSLKDGDKE
jgi:endogenous inhibitor of DNA gyrase (YacG/DUF329 family)